MESRLNLRLDEKDYQRIEKACKLQFLSVSSWCRQQLIIAAKRAEEDSKKKVSAK